MFLRGWWCMELFLLCFLVLTPFSRRFILATAAPDCWYDGKRHREFLSVPTSEPCLNCTCQKGTLLCYLRVCPELPDPPPPGCIIVHKYKTCCPRLICSDSPPIGNELQSRSDPDDVATFFEESPHRQACEYEGSVFEAGSAMTSSSFCEHCFCLGGEQRCIRPKCLLQIQGCQPVYESYSCCPVRYNCTNGNTSSKPHHHHNNHHHHLRRHQLQQQQQSSPTLLDNNFKLGTTTVKPGKKKNNGRTREGCFVSKKYHPEGSKVLGVGYSACDNCYCVRGMVRCEPMSCAPPLLGCTPVIKDGECCATSYNCNNTIEIQPNPTYGEYPEISKDYAKFRKEVPLLWNSKITHNVSPDNNRLHYVIAQSVGYFDDFDFKKQTELGKIHHFNKPTHSSKDLQHNNHKRDTSSDGYVTSKYPNVSSNFKEYVKLSAKLVKLEERVLRKVKNESKEENVITTDRSEEILETTSLSTTSEEQTATTLEETTESSTSTMTTTEYNLLETESTIFDNTSDSTEIIIDDNDYNQTVLTTILTQSTCLESSTTIDELTTEIKEGTENGTKLREENEIELTKTTENTNVSTLSYILLPSISPLVETILNDSIAEEDSPDYDYSEPTLPPSLPNLRIIPFVAADAVDEVNEEDSHHVPLITESPIYTLFSPPTKTEGGFLPKGPPLTINDDFDKNFHITKKMAATEPSSLSSIKLNYSCKVESTTFEHGQSVPNKDNPCTICTCQYGEVKCREPECPPPEIYCQEPSAKEILSCCPTHNCDVNPDYSLVDRMDNFTLSEHQGKISFGNSNSNHSSMQVNSSIQQQQKQKISLPSRYYQQQTPNYVNKPDRKHVNNSYKNNNNNNNNKNVNDDNKSTSSSDTNNQHNHHENNGIIRNKNNIDGSVGILKLAGCNIYGRMYRVGKIIFELSGPCLECRCTDVGVQCKSNKC